MNITNELTDIKDKLLTVKSSNNAAFERKNTATVEQLTSQTESIEGINFKVPSSGIKFNNAPSIDLHNFDTSNVTTMANMFQNCSGLTELDLSTFDTSNVTTMTAMFSGCRNLKNIILDGLNTSNVTSMSNMFSSCSGLTSLDLSNWNTSKLSSANNMFSSCSGLTSLNLSGWNTSSLTMIEGMFSYCSGLTSLNLSNWDASNVTSYSTLFSNCYSLKDLDLSAFKPKVLFSANQMFYKCSGLTSLDLSNWNTTNLTNTQNMFGGCTSLTTINAKGWDITNLTNYYDMFSGCTSLTELYVGEVDDTTYNKWVTILNDSDKYGSAIVKRDGGSTEDSGSTENVDLKFEFTGDSTTFRLNNQTFTATSSPYSATLSDLGLSSITSARSMFASNTSLTKIYNFPELSNTTNVNYMFENCSNLETIDCEIKFTNGGDWEELIGIFDGCTKLTKIKGITYPPYQVLDSISKLFRNCSSLTEIDLTGLKIRYDRETFEYDEVFYGCTSLNKLILGSVSQDLYDWWLARLTDASIQNNVTIEATIV